MLGNINAEICWLLAFVFNICIYLHMQNLSIHKAAAAATTKWGCVALRIRISEGYTRLLTCMSNEQAYSVVSTILY
jgi:hypothetical protein